MITRLYVAGEPVQDQLEALWSAEHAVVDACGGLTMLPGWGAWKDKAGKMVVEKVRVYEILWQTTGERIVAVDSFARALQRIFDQDEVLRVDVQETSVRSYKR